MCLATLVKSLSLEQKIKQYLGNKAVINLQHAIKVHYVNYNTLFHHKHKTKQLFPE